MGQAWVRARRFGRGHQREHQRPGLYDGVTIAGEGRGRAARRRGAKTRDHKRSEHAAHLARRQRCRASAVRRRAQGELRSRPRDARAHDGAARSALPPRSPPPPVESSLSLFELSWRGKSWSRTSQRPGSSTTLSRHPRALEADVATTNDDGLPSGTRIWSGTQRPDRVLLETVKRVPLVEVGVTWELRPWVGVGVALEDQPGAMHLVPTCRTRLSNCSAAAFCAHSARSADCASGPRTVRT